MKVSEKKNISTQMKKKKQGERAKEASLSNPEEIEHSSKFVI